MRRRTLTAAAAVLAFIALQPGTTLARWSDEVEVTPLSTTAAALAAAPLQCQNKPGVLGVLLPYVVVSWTPTTQPASLVYEAIIEERPGLSVPLTGSTTEIRPTLLTSVVGENVTLRVTGRLPGTSWKTEARRTLVLGVAGASVSCGSAA